MADMTSPLQRSSRTTVLLVALAAALSMYGMFSRQSGPMAMAVGMAMAIILRGASAGRPDASTAPAD